MNEDMAGKVPNPAPSVVGTKKARGRPRLESGPALHRLAAVAHLPRRVQAIVLGEAVPSQALHLLTTWQMWLDAQHRSPASPSSERVLVATDNGDYDIHCPDCNRVAKALDLEQMDATGSCGYACRHCDASWRVVFWDKTADVRHAEAPATGALTLAASASDPAYAETLLSHLPSPSQNPLRTVLLPSGRVAPMRNDAHDFRDQLEGAKRKLKRHAARLRGQ